ncbi:MAG: heme biosynthesis protein HemY [Alphaproteobacteria bacterium]|nr:heme biosynthesis protein HemY [Alphaproteobacteria bacterium]
MIRLLRYLIGVGLLVAGAVWLADRPGTVSLDWLGWHVETSMPLLLLICALAAFLLLWLVRLLGLLIGVPGIFGRMRAERRHRQGYESLTRGLVAVAAGDPKEALRQARKADSLLDSPPLSLLLAAQAAQLAGDEEAATQHFDAMLKRKETEFLALRGLITQALKRGDRTSALIQARKAFALKPDAEWVILALFDLLIEERAWEEALELVTKSAKRHLMPDDLAKRRSAILTLELASQSVDAQHALKLAETAFDLLPELPASAVLAAKLLGAKGKQSKAARLLERAWTANPHPSLVDCLKSLSEGEDAVRFVLAVERLVAGAPKNIESHIAVAKAALDARLWGKARSALEPVLAGDRPQARVLALMAAIDEGEGRLSDSVAWIRRLSTAQSNPVWLCSSCGAMADDWSSICPACHGFDRLAWRSPEHLLHLEDASSPSRDLPDESGA